MVENGIRALRLHGPGKLELHEEAMPVAGEGESILSVAAVGVCGSDLHWFRNAGIGDDRLRRPLVLGHEFAGLVREGPLAGRRVAVEPSVNCESCEFCLRGDPNLCPHIQFAGHDTRDGALRDVMAWPSRLLFPLPDSLTDDDGAMLEPLGVALHAVDLAGLRPGMSVGVFGCGPIGLLILQVARLAGAVRIVALDPLSHRLDAARDLGATHVSLVPAGEGTAGRLPRRGGEDLDAVFEAAGENAAVAAAFEAVRPGGKVLLAGIPEEDRTWFPASAARRKGVTAALVRRMKHTYPRAIRLVERGLVDVRSIVTHHFPLERAGEAFETAARREGLKVVIRPGGGG
jgi:L-iditol 2-dehydrogenase